MLLFVIGITEVYTLTIYATVSTRTFPHAGSGFSPPNSPLLSDSFGSCLCFLTQGMAEIKIPPSSSNRSEICRTKSANLSHYFGSRSIPAFRNNGIAKGRQCISVYHIVSTYMFFRARFIFRFVRPLFILK